MRGQSIPDPAVRRICLYLRQLEQLRDQKVQKVSSRELAQALHLSAAQVRKDLGYFGQFGRPGSGYDVKGLIEQLRHILGTDRITNVILVGAGDLGRALLRYRGFGKKGFRLVGAFDVENSKIGRKVGQVVVQHTDQMEKIIRDNGVLLAVVAVPVEAAQEVTDRLQQAGVKGILNFAPVTLQTDPEVSVGPVDIAAYLEQLSFQVHSRQE